MNIAFVEVAEWEKELFAAAFSGHDLFFSPEKLSAVLAGVVDAEIISPFIYSKLDAETLNKLPNLSTVATRSTGVDHIDTEYCNKRGISVRNVPSYGVNTVAEHTFGLILALTRKIVPSVEQTRRGSFSLDGLRGTELFGKTIGIVGLGHIGFRVAELAASFGMKILAVARRSKPELKIRLGIGFVDLQTLLEESDIVTLHVPLTKETKHLVNKENISSLKKGSILINTSRGGVVETEALLWGLDHGTLSGVGLDVLEGECDLKEERALLTEEFLETCDLKTHFLNNALLRRDNVIVTPHNAFNSQEALVEIVRTTIENITSWIEKTHD